MMKEISTDDWDFGSLEDIAVTYPPENPARHLIPEAIAKNVCLSAGITWSADFRRWYEDSLSSLVSDIIVETRVKYYTKQKIELLNKAVLDPASIIEAYVNDNLHENEWLYDDKWQPAFDGLRSILTNFYGPELNKTISLHDTERLLQACRSHFEALSQAEIRFAAKRGRKKLQPLSRAMRYLCRMADLHGLDLTLPANEMACVKESSTPLFRLALSFADHASFKLDRAINSSEPAAFVDFSTLRRTSAWLTSLSPRTLLSYLREEVRLVQAQNSVIRAHQLPPHCTSAIRAFNPSDGIPSEEIQSCSKPEPSGSTRSPNTRR